MNMIINLKENRKKIIYYGSIILMFCSAFLVMFGGKLIAEAAGAYETYVGGKTTQIIFEKEWLDDDESTRPDSITFTVDLEHPSSSPAYTEHDVPITLTKENNWRFEYKDEYGRSWGCWPNSIKEVKVDGYEFVGVKYKYQNGGREAVITLTNKKVEINDGNLMVSNEVTGNAGDKQKDFHFVIVLSDTSINGTFGDMTFTNGVSNEFTLKHNESKTANNIPADVTYEVTEIDANKDGYKTTSVGETGTVEKDKTAQAVFTNTKNVGDLVVSKTVTGNAGNKDKDFTFTVTLDDTSISGNYGDMTFTNGVATFTLQHGESKEAIGLPVGITYEVSESEANKDGYTTSVVGGTGMIESDRAATATFTNTKNVIPPKPDTGSLAVSKVVFGNKGNTNQKFTFKVTLSDTSINGDYGDMHFTNGVATFELKHGEHMTALELPVGLLYKVVESDNEGYIVIKSGDTGSINNGVTMTALFKNYKGSGDELNLPVKPNGLEKQMTPINHNPQTGDETHLNLWLVIMGISAAGLIAMQVTNKRRNEKLGSEN